MALRRVNSLALSTGLRSSRWIQRAAAHTAAAEATPESIGEYDNIIAERRGRVGLVTLNRPKVNAVSDELLNDVIHACKHFDTDSQVGATVITGNEKFFSGGADIKQMSTQTYADAVNTNMFAAWDFVSALNKPIIAAVNGYALGGGCELAMMCDIMIAGENAKFGQPEIKLGVIPGCGGTQRLIRAIGKAKAMDLVLTGRLINAEQAERDGLVARVYPTEELVTKALEMADEIAAFSQPVTAIAKETVNAAHELSLAEGLRLERRLFHSLFALDDQKEGMGAFLEKRAPNFTHK